MVEGVLVQQGRNPNVTSSALPAACLISQLFWLLKVRAKRCLKDSKCQTLAYFSCKSDHYPDAWISFQGWSEDSVDQTHPRCLNILADKSYSWRWRLVTRDRIPSSSTWPCAEGSRPSSFQELLRLCRQVAPFAH
jgi:hypothetical protein